MIADGHVVNINLELGVQSGQEIVINWSGRQHSLSPHIQSENLHRRPHLESDDSASWEDISQVECSVAWVNRLDQSYWSLLSYSHFTYLCSYVHRVTV